MTPGDPQPSITFSYPYRDVFPSKIWFSPAHVGRAAKYTAILLYSILLADLMLFAQGGNVDWRITLAYMIGTAPIAFLRTPGYIRFLLQKQLASDPRKDAIVTWTFSETGIVADFESSRHVYRWDGFLGLWNDKNGLYFFVHKNILFFIPRQVMPPDRYLAVVALATENHKLINQTPSSA